MGEKRTKMLTTQEVAEWFGVNPMTIYRKAKKGELPAIKFGKQWLFPEDALNDWIKENTSPKQRAKNFVSVKDIPEFGKIESIQLVYLFGSAASGHMTPLSDIDIAYLDDGTANPFDFEIELEACVRKAISDAGRIDLVRLRGAPIALRYEVIRAGRLLFAKSDGERASFEEETTKLYLDYEPVLKQYYKNVTK